MSIVGKILGNVSKKSAQVSTAVSPQMLTMQKTAQAAFSKNLAELENFAQSQMPQINAAHKAGLEGLTQLANNVKSML